MDRYRTEPGTTVRLDERDPSDAGEFDKDSAKQWLKTLNARLEELQEWFYAQGKHKLLVVLQSTDTGDKDGTIRHVFEGTNPQGG